MEFTSSSNFRVLTPCFALSYPGFYGGRFTPEATGPYDRGVLGHHAMGSIRYPLFHSVSDGGANNDLLRVYRKSVRQGLNALYT